MKRRLSARGIVLHESKLLAVRLKQSGDTQFNDYWCLPGGTIEEGEPILDAIKREMVEETGVKPHLGSLMYIHQFMSDTLEHTEFFFHIANSTDYLNLDLSKASHAEAELAAIEFIVPSEVTLLPEFLKTEDMQADAKSGTTKFFSYLK